MKIIKEKSFPPTHVRAGEFLRVDYKRADGQLICSAQEQAKEDRTFDTLLVVELTDDDGYGYGFGGIVTSKVKKVVPAEV